MTEGSFDLGQVVATPGALAEFEGDEIEIAITKHQHGDWGDIGQADSEANNDALVGEGRLLSSYTFRGKKLWIITEADRSVTTLLLPSEY